MVVIKGLIGLLFIASAIGILYGLGKLKIKFSKEINKDDNPDFIDIIEDGLIVIMVLLLCFVGLTLTFSIGNAIINSLF
jgi:hypothetical protein